MGKTIELTYKEETRSLADWVRVTGLPYTAIYSRYRKNWEVEKILTKPLSEGVGRPKLYESATERYKAWVERNSKKLIEREQRPERKAYKARHSSKSSF